MPQRTLSRHLSEDGDESSKRESIRKLLEPLGKDQIIELLKQADLKDQSLLSRVTELANSDPTHRKIFIHGLSWDATTDLVLDSFRSYGEIEECKLITDKITGKSKGYAFVLFKTRASAQKTLKQPQKKIGTRTTSCQLAAVGPTATSVSDVGIRKIYVGSVGPNVTAESLRAFFSKFGEIEEGPSGFDPLTHKPRGFAIVYKTAEGAKKVLDEPMKWFDGCQLHCKKFVEYPNNNNNNAQGNAGNQDQQQSNAMTYDIGMKQGMLRSGGLFMGQNPGIGVTANALLGLATPAVGSSLVGNYGIGTLNPGMIGNFGSHIGLHGLGSYQNASMTPSSAGGTSAAMPTSTPSNTQSSFGSVGAYFRL